MNLYNNLIVNSYNKLPNCNPDLIYIDGPDQFDVHGKVGGITTNHPDFLPISSDMLKIEHFLIPRMIFYTMVGVPKLNFKYNSKESGLTKN